MIQSTGMGRDIYTSVSLHRYKGQIHAEGIPDKIRDIMEHGNTHK